MLKSVLKYTSNHYLKKTFPLVFANVQNSTYFVHHDGWQIQSLTTLFPKLSKLKSQTITASKDEELNPNISWSWSKIINSLQRATNKMRIRFKDNNYDNTITTDLHQATRSHQHQIKVWHCYESLSINYQVHSNNIHINILCTKQIIFTG